MTMPTKHAVALRAFDHAGDSFAPGPAFPIDGGHLTDWSSAGLVREATTVEIAKAKGEKPARRAAAKRGRKAKASTPPAAPATDVAPAADPDPGAPTA
jgi:hypothetical protein